MREAVIVDAVRSPIGKRNGGLSKKHSTELLAEVFNGLIERTDLDPTVIGSVVGGCVNQLGMQATNVIRNAWLAAGLPLEVPSATVNSACGSAQEAVTLTYAQVASGLVDVAIAGGVESMSQVVMGSTTPVDGPYGMPRDGYYTDLYEVTTQFEGADRIAETWGLSRADLEQFAKNSQDRAARAWEEDRFAGQIIPIEAPVADDKGDIVGTKTVTRDEGLRATSLEGLAGLKLNQPDRTPPGRHTAGSSSQISDGASAILLTTPEKATELGLTPRARIVDSVLVGSDPVLMLTGPIPATHKLFERTGLSMKDIDVFEVNEAFAAVVCAWAKEFGADMEKVNPNGGAIALGHPLGATGGILIAKALYELERTGGRYGLITMCCGGGLGTGTIIERV